MVGRAGSAGALGGLEERPAQRRWSLARQAAGRAARVGLVDGDVQPGVADGLARGVEKRRASPSSARIVTASAARSRSGASAPGSRPGVARSRAARWSSGASCASSASIIASAMVICSRAVAGSAGRASQARDSAPSSHCAAGRRGDRAPRGCAAATRVADRPACGAGGPSRAARAGARAGSTTPAAGRPSTAPADACASARSLLARLLVPRRAAVSAGSARCTRAPVAWNSSTTNRQPVVASSATSSSRSRKRSANRRTPARSAGATRAARHLTGRRVHPLGGDLRSMLIQSHYDRHKGSPQAPWFERLRGQVPRLS